jgi:hypothetical protein
MKSSARFFIWNDSFDILGQPYLFGSILQLKMQFMSMEPMPSTISLCPACRTMQSHSILCPVVLIGTDPVYGLAECPNCRLRFLVPSPTAEDLNKFYGPHYYGSDWFKQEGRGRVFGRALLPPQPNGRFLDVGCSLGFFLHGIRQSSGWQVHGVEISPDAAAWTREKLGIDIRCGNLTSVDTRPHSSTTFICEM